MRVILQQVTYEKNQWYPSYCNCDSENNWTSNNDYFDFVIFAAIALFVQSIFDLANIIKKTGIRTQCDQNWDKETDEK